MDHQMHMEGQTSAAHKDPAAGHGMLVVGSDTVFCYHLPMFMSPHDYQVILEGTLSQQGADPQRVYREDRKSNPQTHVYTFAPVPFVLPDTFPPANKLKRIRGDLFRGHFEEPDEYPAKAFKIGHGVDVNLANVVFAQKLLPLPPALDRLEYLLFGKGAELFLAHLITRKGDFDQVVSADVKGHEFLGDELRLGVRVQFNGMANVSSQRLTVGKTVSGNALTAGKKVALEVAPRVEWYMSERDLK